MDQTGAQDLNCFTDLFKNIVNSHDPSTKTHSGSVGSAIWESLLQQVGSNPGTNSNAIYNDNKKYISCSGAYRSPRRDTHNGHFMIGGGQRGGNKGRKTPGCSRGTIYLDDSCKMRVASDVDSNNLCGNISLWHEVATPISLVWSEDYKNIPSTVVGFKLNPYSNSTAWMWRGSEALPLLVYDPERNGSITSASQLLGNWTFGGNGFASLMGGASKNSPWRDGYEALSMFDKDQDGKVSGAELDDLSLWFDYNRDGISQKGEVVPLSELNITALYYTADKVENGSRIASLGFERILDGKVVKGSSIDWVEKDIHNGLGTLIDQLSDGVLTSPKSENNPIKTESDLAARNTMQSMVGVWEFTNDAPLSGSGLLAFDDVDGDIIGLSLSMATSANSKEARGMIVFNHFEPTIEGNQFIHFDTETGNGAIMENKISLPITDNTIEGSTTVIGSPSSNSGSYEYKWKAYRVK